MEDLLSGHRPPTVISLFSGALGLDLGLERAGFEIRVAVECNTAAAETIESNRPGLLIPKRLEDVPTGQILKRAGLRKGEASVVTGGPSCQAFSTAGQRRSLEDPRGTMFREFLRVVEEAQPEFFIMENVRGILSAAVKHRPLKERGPAHQPLTSEEQLGSALKEVLKALRATGYYVIFDLVNAADYGVPQTRERILFIGSRDGKPISAPPRTHSRNGAGGLLPWVNLGQALEDFREEVPLFTPLSATKRRFIEQVPEGGNWRDLPIELQSEALGGAYESWGGRGGFYRRLSWERPAPALTTRPDCKATMLIHPSENRPLTVGEYAQIQQFPRDWSFHGSVAQQYVQIGNAVPTGLGEAAGRTILEASAAYPDESRKGKVVCQNQDLLQRLTKRPKTVLNPPRMRGQEQEGELRAWKGDGSEHRRELLKLLDAAS
jgi:DNA (cytosine-5)-methyltransferase 1